LASKFEKSANDILIIFWKKSKKDIKNAKFHADFKIFTSKTNLINMSKSEKVHMSFTFFLITFFGALQPFQRI
jgi:hypothetical protein